MPRSAQILSVVVLASVASSQTPLPLVVEGELLHGAGSVTGIGSVAVGAHGEWLVHVTTDDPAHPSAVVRDGGIWTQVGDAVDEPSGAVIGTFDAFSIDVFGVAWNATLLNTPGGAGDDEVLCYENALWLSEGPVERWPTTDFPEGSRWLSFDDVAMTYNSGMLLLRGRADDPTVPGPEESFAALGSLCSYALLCSLDRIAQEGWPAPGTSELVEAVRLSPASGAMALEHPTLVWSADLTGPEDQDGCVFLFSWPAEHTLLAREGTPSPVPGRTWGPLEDPGVDVIGPDLWTLRAELDPSDPADDGVIVRSGAVFVREGDSLPAIGPAKLEDLGHGRALLDESGRVHWYGSWTQGGRAVAALFRDGEILVRTGTTSIGGRRLVALGSGPDDVALSPQGDRLLFQGTLAGGVEGAFLLELD